MAKFMPHDDIESPPEALYLAFPGMKNHAIGIGVKLRKITSYRTTDGSMRYGNIWQIVQGSLAGMRDSLHVPHLNNA
jgi:hypothetical protein